MHFDSNGYVARKRVKHISFVWYVVSVWFVIGFLTYVLGTNTTAMLQAGLIN